MNIVLLGLGVGMLSLIAPGPINLALVQVGAHKGRRTALHSAAGVMGGDSLLGVVAVLLLAVGAGLPPAVFSSAQILAACMLIGIGVLLALRPGATSASIDRIQRPARAFFLLTSLTPTALAGWVAMLAAMPFAHDTSQIGRFTIGVLIASYIWHPTLGLTASAIGSRLTMKGQLLLSRAGGVGMGALGAGLVLTQI